MPAFIMLEKHFLAHSYCYTHYAVVFVTGNARQFEPHCMKCVLPFQLLRLLPFYSLTSLYLTTWIQLLEFRATLSASGQHRALHISHHVSRCLHTPSHSEYHNLYSVLSKFQSVCISKLVSCWHTVSHSELSCKHSPTLHIKFCHALCILLATLHAPYCLNSTTLHIAMFTFPEWMSQLIFHRHAQTLCI
jgi:hypothetical protein